MIIADIQYKKQLSNFIRKQRETKKISLNSFAYKNGIEPSTLSRIEKGLLELKLSNLIKIAKGFNSSPSEFLKLFESNLDKQ